MHLGSLWLVRWRAPVRRVEMGMPLRRRHHCKGPDHDPRNIWKDLSDQIQMMEVRMPLGGAGFGYPVRARLGGYREASAQGDAGLPERTQDLRPGLNYHTNVSKIIQNNPCLIIFKGFSHGCPL
jgi:hypothetical protein